MKKQELVVHYMREGWTRCGLMGGSQGSWPDNHRWVGPGAENKVENCNVCVKSAKDIIKKMRK